MDKPMRDDELDFDVGTMEGITALVEFIAEETEQTMFRTKGLMQSCTLFVLKDVNGRDIDTATPLMLPQEKGWKEMRSAVRNGYLRYNARGVLRVHSEGRRVLFQVEHVEFGDLVWYATPDEHGMFGKLIGPVALDKLEFPKLKVIPRLYMS